MKTEWIKVEDGMPKIGSAILIFCEILDIHVSFYDGAGKFTHPYYDSFKPTHWMPLPKLPKQ